MKPLDARRLTDTELEKLIHETGKPPIPPDAARTRVAEAMKKRIQGWKDGTIIEPAHAIIPEVRIHQTTGRTIPFVRFVPLIVAAAAALVLVPLVVVQTGRSEALSGIVARPMTAPWGAFDKTATARAVEKGEVAVGHDASIAMTWHHNTLFAFGPGTRATLTKSDNGGASINLDPGSFYIDRRDPGRSIKVQTPDCEVAFTGTRALVERNEDSTTVTCFEGKVELISMDRIPSVTLSPGKSVRMKTGKPLGDIGEAGQSAMTVDTAMVTVLGVEKAPATPGTTTVASVAPSPTPLFSIEKAGTIPAGNPPLVWQGDKNALVLSGAGCYLSKENGFVPVMGAPSAWTSAPMLLGDFFILAAGNAVRAIDSSTLALSGSIELSGTEAVADNYRGAAIGETILLPVR